MKAMVLFSGGLDSSTCLALAVKKYGPEDVTALSVYYGQRHGRELRSAAAVAEHYGVKWKTLDLAAAFADSDCSLLSGSEGNIPRESAVESLDLAAALENLAANSEYVTGPVLLGLILLSKAELDIFVVVDRECLDFVSSIGLDLDHDTAVDGSREHVAAIIVGMLTNKVDSSGGGEHLTFSLVQGFKFLPDFGFHFHNYAIRELIIHSHKYNKYYLIMSVMGQ